MIVGALIGVVSFVAGVIVGIVGWAHHGIVLEKRA